MEREIIAQSLIVLAICVGGWMLLVQPKVEELGELEQVLQERLADASMTDQSAIKEMADQLEDIRQQAQTVKQKNRLGSESSESYSMLMSLAEDRGVLVKSLQPGTDQETSNDGSVTRTRIEMTLEGEYEKIARFLKGVEELSGYISPVSLSISPKQHEGLPIVVARYTCEALTFTLPDNLDVLQGVVHAEQ